MSGPDFSKHEQPQQEQQEPSGANPPPGYNPQQQYGQQQYGQQQYPQQAYGQPYPGQPYSGQPYPGQPYPGQPYPGQPYPPQPYGPGYPPYAVQKPTGWFIVNWLFFWPTAIYSLVTHWNNIDRDLYYGNLDGARKHADGVRRHGIIALCISLGLIVLWIILAVTLLASVGHCVSTSTSNSFSTSC